MCRTSCPPGLVPPTNPGGPSRASWRTSRQAPTLVVSGSAMPFRAPSASRSCLGSITCTTSIAIRQEVRAMGADPPRRRRHTRLRAWRSQDRDLAGAGGPPADRRGGHTAAWTPDPVRDDRDSDASRGACVLSVPRSRQPSSSCARCPPFRRRRVLPPRTRIDWDWASQKDRISSPDRCRGQARTSGGTCSTLGDSRTVGSP